MKIIEQLPESKNGIETHPQSITKMISHYSFCDFNDFNLWYKFSICG